MSPCFGKYVRMTLPETTRLFASSEIPRRRSEQPQAPGASKTTTHLPLRKGPETVTPPNRRCQPPHSRRPQGEDVHGAECPSRGKHSLLAGERGAASGGLNPGVIPTDGRNPPHGPRSASIRAVHGGWTGRRDRYARPPPPLPPRGRVIFRIPVGDPPLGPKDTGAPP